MKTRRYVAAAVHVTGCAVALTLLWQAVRFCKGRVGAPLVDQAIAIADLLFPSLPNGDPSPVAPVLGWLGQAFYYLYGVAAWVMIAFLASRCLYVIARVIAVGLQQYCAEVAAARAEDARRERVTSARSRRLELRKRRDEPRTGGALSAAAIGTLFGFAIAFLSSGSR
ncbi:hypothetical protein ACO2TQ_35745 [Burkholderia sp. OKR4-1]|uniref:hypothetical protein n=1 Tax=Burkholderia TaxID=32008 RepID=UPI0024C0FDDF|nr:hypothetical protein [Burkholderia contaminans]MDK0996904.1 hypothetical protein [Burkholderia contaminans]